MQLYISNKKIIFLGTLFNFYLRSIWEAISALNADLKLKVKNIDRKHVFTIALVSNLKSNFFTNEKQVKAEYGK